MVVTTIVGGILRDSQPCRSLDELMLQLVVGSVERHGQRTAMAKFVCNISGDGSGSSIIVDSTGLMHGSYEHWLSLMVILYMVVLYCQLFTQNYLLLWKYVWLYPTQNKIWPIKLLFLQQFAKALPGHRITR